MNTIINERVVLCIEMIVVVKTTAKEGVPKLRHALQDIFISQPPISKVLDAPIYH